MDPSGFQELLDEFLLEARERAGEVEALMLRMATGDAATRKTDLAQVKRELHTLKGNAGMMGFSDLQALAHRLEDEVERLDVGDPSIDPVLGGIDELRGALEEIGTAAPRPAPQAETSEEEAPVAAGLLAATASSVRLPFAKIDQLVEIQAETLIFRNRLSDAVHRGLEEARKTGGDPEVFRRDVTAALEDVEEAREALEKTLNLLQEQVTELGMVPLQSLFHSLGRVVYDESSREGKQVDFEIHGGETPIDKTLLEAASEVLGHLVRNAVIHGIESPAERRRRGKPGRGKVRVAAALEGGEVRIDVADDGGGIDYEALRDKAKAARAGVAGRNDLDPGDSPHALLFAEGLSTREDAGLGAGRGVGLSAVKRSVEAHSGRIEIFSERGTGTSFVLRLPLTTSILRSLLVTADGEEYALPLASVTESQRLEVLDRHELNHAPVVPWRGRLVPLVDLGLAFGTRESVREAGYFVIIEVDGRHRGLAIDDIVGIRDIVVKGLDKIVGQPVGVSGSTILGDGRVIMILDPHQLATLPPFIGAVARA